MEVSERESGRVSNGNAILDPPRDKGDVVPYVEAAVAVLVSLDIDRARIIEALNRAAAGLADKQ